MRLILPDTYGEDPEAVPLFTSIAGLQYYSYWKADDLYGTVAPKTADRLQLIRVPENRFDANAIEVWFRNGQFHLGHVPAKLAKWIAAPMDEGRSLRAYIVNGGSGKPWSASMVMFGEALDVMPSYLREAMMKV